MAHWEPKVKNGSDLWLRGTAYHVKKKKKKQLGKVIEMDPQNLARDPSHGTQKESLAQKQKVTR